MASVSSLICLLFFGGCIIMTAESEETVEWFPMGTGYQYLVIWEANNWDAARHVCQQVGGDLAVHGMKHYGTRLAIGNIMMNGNEFWIGLHDLYQEGKWQWLDGSNADSSNTHWDKNEPNDKGKEGEDCAGIAAGRGFRANDFKCSKAISALCEKRTEQ